MANYFICRQQSVKIFYSTQKHFLPYSDVLICDKWSVFSATETALNTGATISATIKMAYTKVLYPNGTAIQRLNTKIYVDTLLLANVWRYIKKEITWKSFSHELS